MQTINLVELYNMLPNKSKHLLKSKVQNEAGWSEATFYTKISDYSNLNKMECRLLIMEMKLELAKLVYEIQECILFLENKKI